MASLIVTNPKSEKVTDVYKTPETSHQMASFLTIAFPLAARTSVHLALAARILLGWYRSQSIISSIFMTSDTPSSAQWTRSFPRLGLPCHDWGLGYMGSTLGEDKVVWIVRWSSLMKGQRVQFPACSEWSKFGNLDHLHPLGVPRRAPRLVGGLLCHRVELSPLIEFSVIDIRGSSLVWVVLWFLLVADTPAKVHQASIVSDIEILFSTLIYPTRRRNTSRSPLQR